MLSRRHIRVKVMQTLYSYYQTHQADMNLSEKSLFRSMDKFYEAYLGLLQLLTEFQYVAQQMVQEAEQRHIKKSDSIDTFPRFAENKVLEQLSRNGSLARLCKKHNVSWESDRETIRKILLEFRKTPEYKVYVTSETNTFIEDRDFLINFYKKHILHNELLNFAQEERNMHWHDDDEFIHSMVLKSLKATSEEADPDKLILPLFKDEEDDINFAKNLFRKTIVHNEELELKIADKTKNWEVDRIAFTDMILMKMALAEILYFPNVPVKVSINEYIDISKEYSTPKSKQFINGVIDKIVDELKAGNLIQKTGRGLME